MTLAIEAYVVDASVAAKWYLRDEEDTAGADLLLHRFAQGHLDLLTPDHVRLEFIAAITKATRGRRARLTPDQGISAIEEFLALGLRSLDTEPLFLPAFNLAHQLGCAFYDALYLALSEQFALPLITADKRFYNAGRRYSSIMWIADYS